MRYVAHRRLKLGTGFREIGDEVPEAQEWKNLSTYLRLGWIVEEPGESTAVVVTDEGGQDDLSSLTVTALRSKAKAAGLTGLSKLRKSDLVALLNG